MPWQNTAEARAPLWAGLFPALGLPSTAWRLAFVEEWQRWEATGAGYNPLATTQPGGEDPASPWWNTFGDKGQYHVRNYRDLASGVAALATTITNGYYPSLEDAITRQSLDSPLLVAANIDTWGTANFANVIRNGWQPPHELVSEDGRLYQLAEQVFGGQERQPGYAPVTFRQLFDRVVALEAAREIGSIPPHTHVPGGVQE